MSLETLYCNISHSVEGNVQLKQLFIFCYIEHSVAVRNTQFKLIVGQYLVQVFSDVLVTFLYFDICQIVANIKIWKRHINIREGSD